LSVAVVLTAAADLRTQRAARSAAEASVAALQAQLAALPDLKQSSSAAAEAAAQAAAQAAQAAVAEASAKSAALEQALEAERKVCPCLPLVALYSPYVRPGDRQQRLRVRTRQRPVRSATAAWSSLPWRKRSCRLPRLCVAMGSALSVMRG
jgi:hypothetical protein